MKTNYEVRRKLVEDIIRASPYLVTWEEVTDEVSKYVLNASMIGKGIYVITAFPKKLVINNASQRVWAQVSYDCPSDINEWLAPICGKRLKNKAVFQA